jgi:hypothetical protein
MRRPAALLSLLIGLAVVVAAQLIAPLGSPPLYDGVVVGEPYRYLAPGPGQVGSPTSFSSQLPVAGTTSPQIVAATTESPPQAQLIAAPGAFVIPTGVGSLDVSVEPVAAQASPSDGPIAGNVYRFAVSDPTGTALTVNTRTLPTVVLRAPDGVIDATIGRYVGAGWQELPTEPSGQPGIYLTNASALGDFALIATPNPGLLGLDPRLVATGVVTGVLSALAIGYLQARSRRQPITSSGASHQGPPWPPKRRRARRRRGGQR